MPGFCYAVLLDDVELFECARAMACEIVDADPELVGPEHALLAGVLCRLYGEIERFVISV